MSILSSRPALRWVAPVAVLAIALGGGAIGQSLNADAATPLPARTAAQLLVDLQTSAVAGLSGTVVQKSALGLPELPSVGGQGSSDFSALVTGTHTLRVWYAGPDRQRVALLGTLGESDLIHNGQDVWSWSSDTNAATHLRLPAAASDSGPALEMPLPTDLPTTPQQAADAALAAIDPTTVVSTDGTATVASRAAYELVLSPRDSASRVGQVRIAVDAERHVPLRVRVFPRAVSTPSIEIGFTQVSFATPGDEQFSFTPPPGATVSETSPDALTGTAPAAQDASGSSEPRLIGTGWTTVAVLDTSAGSTEGTAGQLGEVLGALPRVSGAWGSGRLLQSALFCALLTDDGRLIVGAVDPARLYQVAQQ